MAAADCQDLFRRWKPAGGYQLAAFRNAFAEIQLQELDGRSTFRSQADNSYILDPELFLPDLRSRIEQGHNIS